MFYKRNFHSRFTDGSEESEIRNIMVDILLASFNGEKFIREQLDSLLEQTYKDFRIIIRDDGSNDATVNIIESYFEKYPEKIMLIKDKNNCGSATSNFIELTKYAESDYVMYCDQDDIWFPNKIEVTLMKMLDVEKKYNEKKPILIYSSYIIVNQKLDRMNMINTQVYKHKIALNNLLVQNCVTGCLMMINKPLYSMVGEYHKDILMHDWWIALIASSVGEIVHMPEELMYYRQHENNVVGVVNVRTPSYCIKKIFDKNVKYAKVKYKGQAKLLRERVDTYLQPESKKIIDDFLLIYKEDSKLKRMRMLIKGKYLKSNFTRRIGQIWYI